MAILYFVWNWTFFFFFGIELVVLGTLKNKRSRDTLSYQLPILYMEGTFTNNIQAQTSAGIDVIIARQVVLLLYKLCGTQLFI